MDTESGVDDRKLLCATHWKKTLQETEFLPMESTELPCHVELVDELSSARATKTPSKLEEYETKFLGHKELVKQLLKSTVTASADLRKTIINTRRRSQKEEDDKQTAGKKSSARHRLTARRWLQTRAWSRRAGRPSVWTCKIWASRSSATARKMIFPKHAKMATRCSTLSHGSWRSAKP